jgi:hypothetical protein
MIKFIIWLGEAYLWCLPRSIRRFYTDYGILSLMVWAVTVSAVLAIVTMCILHFLPPWVTAVVMLVCWLYNTFYGSYFRRDHARN